MAKVIAVNKVNGTIVNEADIMDDVYMWLCTASNGAYKLSFERAKTKRSLNQNALMWMWFTAIAKAWSEACGRSFTRQDVHDAYCKTFLPMDTPKGRIPGSTSSLTKEQMSEFMNNIQADAATEYCIQLPTPEDKFFESWASEYSER